MTLIKRNDFPPDFAKIFIGFDDLINDFAQVNSYFENKYPPYNMIREDADNYLIEMAVAGFSPEQISVSSKNGYLHVSAKSTSSEKEDAREYIYRGLAARTFEHKFKLYEYLLVKNVEFSNGILKIKLERKLPDHLKEQVFPVSTTNQLKS